MVLGVRGWSAKEEGLNQGRRMREQRGCAKALPQGEEWWETSAWGWGKEDKWAQVHGKKRCEKTKWGKRRKMSRLSGARKIEHFGMAKRSGICLEYENLRKYQCDGLTLIGFWMPTKAALSLCFLAGQLALGPHCTWRKLLETSYRSPPCSPPLPNHTNPIHTTPYICDSNL